MAQHPAPNPGCFKAAYPCTGWTQTQCVQAPQHSLQVGNKTDFVASAGSGSVIASASGSFQNVTVTGEHDSQAPNAGANDFSLQMNTNTFPTNTSNAGYNNQGTSNNPCMGSGGEALCMGWQQFILANDPTDSGQTGAWLYIQYWLMFPEGGQLIGYYQKNGVCPSSQIQGGLWASGWSRGGPTTPAAI